MGDILVLSNVIKRFGSFAAVDRFNLRMPQGEVLGFLGPNGAGKTTTIRMVMGITFPDSGSLSVLGASNATEVKDRVGYLPEERGLYRKMTVEATLRYFGALKGLSGRVLTQRIDEGLERIGLANWRKSKVEALSKGMQQKIQFVATILNRPELLILDEPFSGLDPINAEMLETLLEDLRRQRTTVIFSTHQMETAERLCDRIVLINRGRSLVEGPLAEIKGRFSTRTIVLEGSGEMQEAANWEGVVRSQITAGQALLTLAEGFDPQRILRSAVESLRLTRFEVLRPSLQEIFVQLVGQDRIPEETADQSRNGSMGISASSPEVAHV